MHVELEQLGEGERALSHDIPQLYEEIKDAEMKNIAETAGIAAPSSVAATVPEYEDVMLAGEISKSSDPLSHYAPLMGCHSVINS